MLFGAVVCTRGPGCVWVPVVFDPLRSFPVATIVIMCCYRGTASAVWKPFIMVMLSRWGLSCVCMHATHQFSRCAVGLAVGCALLHAFLLSGGY